MTKEDNILLTIPKDITNGEVIKTVFKPYKIEVFSQEVRVYFTKDYWQIFGIKWWNAQYKEREDNNVETI